jgi:hypothetical protein
VAAAWRGGGRNPRGLRRPGAAACCRPVGRWQRRPKEAAARLGGGGGVPEEAAARPGEGGGVQGRRLLGLAEAKKT